MGLRVAAAPPGPGSPDAGAIRRVQALPGDGHDRDPARRQRAVHLLAGWQPARRPGPRPARVLGGLRRDGRPVAGGRRGACARDLDDRRRSRRQRHGYLGDGRRPLWRLRHARVHERQGPGELSTPIPDHLPQRGAAGRAAAADDADPRSTDRRERRLGRDLRAGARAVVPGGRQGAGRGRHVPPVECMDAGRGRGRGRARARRHDGDLQLRQVPGHRTGRRGVAVVAAHCADAGRRTDHADGDAQRCGPDRRRVHGRPPDGCRRVVPVRLAAGGGPPLALVPAPPAGGRVRALRGARPGAHRACPSRGRGRATSWPPSPRTSTSRPRRSRS